MTKTFETTIDMDSKTCTQVIAILNQQLADTFDLYTQTKQAHWNVKGMNFMQLHELFDKLAETVFPYVDVIAERALILGGTALGTARMSAKASRLEEMAEYFKDEREAVRMLVDRYAALAKSTRKAIDECADIGDADTADLFTAISRSLDKSRWFLEAHIQ